MTRRGTPMPQKARPATAAKAARARWDNTPVSEDLFKRMAAAVPRLTTEQAAELRRLLDIVYYGESQ